MGATIQLGKGVSHTKRVKINSSRLWKSQDFGSEKPNHIAGATVEWFRLNNIHEQRTGPFKV